MTLDQLIRALGGPSAVARKLGGKISRQGVYNWVYKSRVPSSARLPLMQLAETERLDIPEELSQ